VLLGCAFCFLARPLALCLLLVWLGVRMSILDHNGSGIAAMVGKNCVGIASDTRLGVGAQTVSCNFKKVFKIHDKLYYGLAGLGTDVQTMSELLSFRMNMYELRESRKVKPSTFGNVVANILYSKRFGPYFTEPVIAGLEGPENKPYLAAMDLIGAPVFTDDFLVAGTCSDNLYGTCESLYQKDMDPETLFETLSQALLAAVDRDALSGWGATVTIITPTETITRQLKARMD